MASVDELGGTASDVAAVVLAGGFSTRYGERDKALAAVDGTPMVRRVVDGVGVVSDAVIVNCRASQRPGFADVLSDVDVPLAFAIDPVPDRGPLAGLAAGLACHDAPFTVVVACDMPDVDPRFLEAMLDRFGPATEAVVPRPDKYLQPAQSVLRTAPARAAASDALDADERNLRALVDRLDAAVLDPATIAALGGMDSLRDVNRPGE